MADSHYEGILSTVYCAGCGGETSLERISEHPCFQGDNTDLYLDGNIVSNSSEQLQNFLDGCNKRCNINKAHESSVEEEAVMQDIEVDEDGVAVTSDENYIHMLELIKNKPCIWNHNLPLSKRSPGLIADAWISILKFFKGWNVEAIKKRFSNLKVTYTRRKKGAPSGSGAFPRKRWILDPYMTFLHDILQDEGRSTRSNVSPERGSCTEDSSQEYFTAPEGSEDENISSIKKGNFRFTAASSLGKKRKPTEDSLEAAVVQFISEKRAKSNQNVLKPIEQWSLWLANEISSFPLISDRLQIQNYITNYISEKRSSIESE
ncbi:uncharacterized protein LOC122506362 [Leptopilina heterotoma]|uniref:uncharacterized protein LOC122506362 n=1 Tax=Leptopilina heterotoma TaxID=63436 RepID=UPI001CA7B89D|nr:uncharacterized protein LOC122506362 [Leptopilina heterotoma]